MYFYFYWLILFREERDRMWCEVLGDIVELMMDADHHTVNKSAHNGGDPHHPAWGNDHRGEAIFRGG